MKHLERNTALLLVLPFAAGVLSGCDVQGKRTEATAAVAAPGPAATKKAILGPEFFTLARCDDAIDYIDSRTDGAANVDFDRISHVFIVELNEVDPRNLVGSVTKKKPNATFDGEDPSDPGVPASPSDKPKPSKLDFDVDIGAPEVRGGKTYYKTALIKIILKPNIGHRISLVEAAYTIRAGDRNGQYMFCDANRVDDNTATFRVYHYPEDNKAYGSFNIGLKVEDRGRKHETTIFIDPEVKNDG